LISLGTEKMLLNFGKAGWVSKARQQPDKVKMVIDKIKTDGLMPTVDTVMNKLSTPMPLGYSNAGEVIAVGAGVTNFQIGDRVISNGNHAEIVCVPENLCSKIPDNVSDDEAAFTVVAAIALQGVRLASPTLGENVIVIGLGLIGLITVQLLKANGCNVIGFDFDEKKVQLSKEYGANSFTTVDTLEIEKIVGNLTNNNGADSVIITASTSSNDPIDVAPKICRHRGRVVLVGVVGLEMNRTEFFKKEITFQVSCSYGPGRYDFGYEQKGLDYPIGFVRWTENRNFQAVLNLLEQNKIDFKKLISRSEPFENASKIYEDLTEVKDVLGFLLEYPIQINNSDKCLKISNKQQTNSSVVIGIIGAGAFTSGTLLPAFKKTSARIKSISSSAGLSGHNAAVKFGIEENTTDYKSILSDSEVNTIVISTPHNTHGSFVLESLMAGKNVFVEKPLALKMEEISKIETFYKENSNAPQLMVGFNRRFSPLSVTLKNKLDCLSGPKAIIYTVNSGFIPPDHWTQNMDIGGQRLLGEGCHFIDYIQFLIGSEIVASNIFFADVESRDVFTISLKFKDGSIGTVNYFSNGNKAYAKEKIDVFCDSNIYTLDNFKSLTTIDSKGRKTSDKLSRQDKGHQAEISLFVQAIENGDKFPIELSELLETSKLAIELNA
jgi:predicted dehydrogenase/threonine dehydrogenase-like Zn-dependent dehydrogenase